MGTVYKARDIRLDRTVAIKVVPRPATGDSQPAFVGEARTLARLSHPNIVRVYDVGEFEGGLYLVTEFIEGRSLAEILQSGTRLDPDEATEIIAQVGQALAFMHRHNLTHRDIKPANILVCDSGRVLLSDLGLAVQFNDALLTTAGTVLGTPRYMSPEQAMGSRLDGRSDIYSLAVVLHEALSGHSSYGRSESADILRKVVETPLPPIRQLNPGVSDAIAEILNKALAKNPQARYSTAEEFVSALRAARQISARESDIAQPRAQTVGRTLDVDDLPATASVAPYSAGGSHRFEEFASLWNELSRTVTSDRDRFVAAATTIAAGLLREAVGYRIEQAIPYLKGTVGYFVEAPFLWIRYSRFPILFVAYDQPNPDVLAIVVQQLEIAKATEYFALLIVVPPQGKETGREARELNDLVADSVYRHDFVVLDREHLTRLIAENSSRALVEIILEQRTELLATLSPYIVSGPVPENMFFGRESQLKMISQGIGRSDFAIVGGRRIGKSSILLRLRRLFGDDPRYRAIYLDCEARFDYENFFAGLGESLDVPVDGTPSSFQQITKALGHGRPSQMVVFLLDEIDELLDFDSKRRPSGALFKAFRAASQEGVCRFVFSGSRTLYRHLRDAHSPFFNFCEAITVGRLEEKSIVEIVCKPMLQLGFEIPDRERLVSRFIELTSSHPNLAQWMCDRLIKTSIEKSITVEALEQLATTPEFQEHYVSTAWGDATPHEKLITLLMEGPAFSDNDVRQKLTEVNLSRDDRALRDSLEILRLYSLLDRDDSGYRFALSQFPRIVRESGVAATQTEWLVNEVRNRCS